MSSDQNTMPLSGQTDRSSGVDISDLAKRVAELSHELERLAQEARQVPQNNEKSAPPHEGADTRPIYPPQSNPPFPHQAPPVNRVHENKGLDTLRQNVVVESTFRNTASMAPRSDLSATPAPPPQKKEEISAAPEAAHQFFDTIEWHARNQAAQQALETERATTPEVPLPASETKPRVEEPNPDRPSFDTRITGSDQTGVVFGKKEENVSQSAVSPQPAATLDGIRTNGEQISTTVSQGGNVRQMYSSPLTGGAPIPTTLQPVRTFQSDIAHSVNTQHTSVVSVVAAEQNRNESRRKERVARESSVPAGVGAYIKVGLSGLFVGVGVAGVLFAIVSFSKGDKVVVEEKLPEYVFTEQQTRVDTTGQSRREFMNTLLAEKEKVSLPLGAIAYLYLTITSKTPEGTERVNLLSTASFFERIEATVPGALTRSLEPLMMLGVHVFDGNQPFLIFKVNFFENAFAGMLQWEDTMHSDLAPLFGPAFVELPSRTDATSNNETIGLPYGAGFTDQIIRNKEARVLERRTDGAVVLLYGFIDRNTLVITTNVQTFAEVTTRLNSRRF